MRRGRAALVLVPPNADVEFVGGREGGREGPRKEQGSEREKKEERRGEREVSEYRRKEGREGGREGGAYLHGVILLVSLGRLCHALQGFDEAALVHVLAICVW